MENGSRLGASIEAMRHYFPNFSRSIRKVGSRNVAVWQGSVQPIQSSEQLIELLDDIHNERPVKVIASGKIEHDSSCIATHRKHEWFDELKDFQISYDLAVVYDGSPSHPKAFVPNLVTPPHGYRHLNRDGSICAYAFWENIWLWQRDTVADYLGHALTWLIKWTIWCQVAVWIGPEVRHDPSFLVSEIGRNQQCRCGSGRKYKKCHLNADFQMASRKR